MKLVSNDESSPFQFRISLSWLWLTAWRFCIFNNDDSLKRRNSSQKQVERSRIYVHLYIREKINRIDNVRSRACPYSLYPHPPVIFGTLSKHPHSIYWENIDVQQHCEFGSLRVHNPALLVQKTYRIQIISVYYLEYQNAKY